MSTCQSLKSYTVRKEIIFVRSRPKWFKLESTRLMLPTTCQIQIQSPNRLSSVPVYSSVPEHSCLLQQTACGMNRHRHRLLQSLRYCAIAARRAAHVMEDLWRHIEVEAPRVL
jgi:hypothetical protein